MRTKFERGARIERSEINPLTSKSAVRRLEAPAGMRTKFDRLRFASAKRIVVDEVILRRSPATNPLR